MCGSLGNVIDDPLYITLMELLEVRKQEQEKANNNPACGPATQIDIIFEDSSEPSPVRKLDTATWWLLLDKQADGSLKPSKYPSFNTRSDKLNVPRSAGYTAYRQSRCIIPATFVIEGEGGKHNRRYHKIEPQRCGFALGGLYRRWVNEQTGDVIKSCSVITLPPHPAWQDIHSKSTPLFLPTHNKELIDQWLDPHFHDVGYFDEILKPEFPEDLIVTPIERPGNLAAVGKSFVIKR